MAHANGELVSRAIAAVVGGYALAYACTAVVSVLLTAGGLPRADAVVTASMLSFVVYLAAIVYAFGARSAWRAWSRIGAATLIFGGGAALIALSH